MREAQLSWLRDIRTGYWSKCCGSIESNAKRDVDNAEVDALERTSYRKVVCASIREINQCTEVTPPTVTDSQRESITEYITKRTSSRPKNVY